LNNAGIVCGDIVFLVAIRTVLEAKTVSALRVDFWAFRAIWVFNQTMATTPKMLKDITFCVFSAPKCICKIALRAMDLNRN
jgi:hypothetical protein